MAVDAALVMIGVGIWGFLIFGLKDCVEAVVSGRVKVAEANARAEEARTERAKLEHKPLT